MTFQVTALLTNNSRQIFGGIYEVRKRITVSIARYYGYLTAVPYTGEILQTNYT